MTQGTYELRKLTPEAYSELERIADETPEVYLLPDTDFGNLLADAGVSHENQTTGTGIFGHAPIHLEPVTSGDLNEADRQALDFYEAYSDLRPAKAQDHLMWGWISHFVLHKYSLGRWRASTGNVPNWIRRHWFANSLGVIRKYNTASRTWWIAHTATTAGANSAGAFSKHEALEHFATHARHYHNMLDSGFSRNPVVLAEFVRVLMSQADGVNTKGLDAIWKRMNLASGILVFDAMPRDAIRLHLENIVDEIMSEPALVADRRKLRNSKPFRVLSLGAGVQSSCLALMADREEFGLERPDIAIFADTGWEPPAVYEHLEWLKSQLSYEVVTVSSGNIRDNILEGKMPDGSKFLGIPAFLANEDGSKGILNRQCTTHYKTNPIQAYLRERLGLQKGRRAPVGVQVEMWLGISIDEALRQKADREEWVTKRYPLIERGFSRAQLYKWFQENYVGRPLPTSSCIGCPYHTDAIWKQLKDSDPDSFSDAVFVDEALRKVPSVRGTIKGQAFLHRSRTPLVEVDFTEAKNYDNLMLEECDGVCGI